MSPVRIRLIASWLWVHNSASGDQHRGPKTVLCVTGTRFRTKSGRGVYAPAPFCHETVYLCSGFAVKNFSAQTGLCVTGTVFGTDSVRGVYARALLFYETVYLCSGILTTTRDLPRLSLEVVVVSGQRRPPRTKMKAHGSGVVAF